MSCETFSEDLPGYAGGNLAVAERALIEAHLRTCRPCQDEVRALERLDRLLHEGLPWVEPSPELQRRFMNRLAAEIEAETQPSEERESLLSWLLRPWLIPAVATAALAVLVLAGSFGSGRDVPTRIAREPAPSDGPAPAVAVVAAPQAAPAAEAPAAAPLAVAGAKRDPGRSVPADLERDPDLFVDFAIIKELEILRAIDPSSGSAG